MSASDNKPVDMDAKDLAMDRIERGLLEVVSILEELKSEQPDDRLQISINALGVCVSILRGDA